MTATVDLINRYLHIGDLYLFNTGQAEMAYLTLGCHYLPEAGLHCFAVWAPNALAVSVVGDFNGWDSNAHPMTKHQTGVFVAFIPGLKDGDIYKYYLRQYGGAIAYKSDPFAFHAETGEKTASKVWEINGYPWGDRAYLAHRAAQEARRSPLSIYELHIGSWRKGPDEVYPNYRRVADGLAAYCAKMGYTHVELLPITEYPYEESWGYQVTGYYAPTSRYGTPQDFMYLVDTLHQHNIGVIIDWVPAHFPRDAHGLARFDGTALFEHENPLQANHPEWGTLIFNYGRPEVQSFLISSAVFFFDVYHIDGIRVDAVSSMLYLDYGRGPGQFIPNKDGGNIDYSAVDFLRRLNSTVLTRFPGGMTIAEESTAYPLISYPPDVGGLGFSFKWDMGFMHDTLEYFSMDPLFRKYHHDKLTFSLMYAFAENFILAFSHDEVVHGKKSLLDKMFGDYDQKFATLRAMFGYQYGHPGKKLNFMGSEFGQFIEWNHKQQLDWLLLTYPRHVEMQRYVRELNLLYRKYPALWQIDDSWDGFRWLSVDEREKSAVAFLRSAADETEPHLICALNFTPVATELSFELPPGSITELLSSNETRFGGGGEDKKPQIYRHKSGGQRIMIPLPPLTAVYYRYDLIQEVREDDN